MSMSSTDIIAFKHVNEATGYRGPTKYRVGEKIFQVPPWNHPAAIANKILAWTVHVIFYGVYIVAPMGHGKTTIAQTLAHFIHTMASKGIKIGDRVQKYDFRVIWASAHEFTHQEAFYNSLPKKTPHIIIFDDISGALKQLREQEMEKQFSTLTRVREIIDPETKRTPVITIVVGHYSKNLEKEFRAQLGMSIYASFGNEERTNLDSIAEKGSDAYRTLKHFGDIYSEQYENHKFCLYLPNGVPLWYTTDEPFRCAAAIRKTGGGMFLFSNHDACDKCKKKFLRRLIEPEIIYNKLFAIYNNAGITEWQHALARRGYPHAIGNVQQAALRFVENELEAIYDYDPEKAIKLIWSKRKRKVPKRTYTHHKKNEEILEEWDRNSQMVQMEHRNPTMNLKAAESTEAAFGETNEPQEVNDEREDNVAE